PADLGVEVGVDIHEPGADDASRGVDRLAAVSVDVTDSGDPVAGHRHVGPERRTPGAVDHGSVPDHEVVCHACPLQRGAIGAYARSKTALAPSIRPRQTYTLI